MPAGGSSGKPSREVDQGTQLKPPEMLRCAGGLRAALVALQGIRPRFFSVVVPAAAAAAAPEAKSTLADLLPPRTVPKPRKRPRVIPALGPQVGFYAKLATTVPGFFDETPSSPFQRPLVATHTARRSTARAPPGHYQPDKGKRSKGAVDAPSKLPEAVAMTTSPEQGGVAAAAEEAPERVFAVVALGGTQYKVSAGDIINAEYVPGAAVGSELVLDRVLVAGSVARTVLGRPVIPGAVVRCAVEEQVRPAAAGMSPNPSHIQAGFLPTP